MGQSPSIDSNNRKFSPHAKMRLAEFFGYNPVLKDSIMGLLNELMGAVVAVEAVDKLDPEARFFKKALLQLRALKVKS